MSKVCFIVGGSKGLGAELVARYNQNGYQVIEFSRSGNGEQHVALDLSRRETAIDAVDLAFANVAKTQPSDIVLIINAGSLFPMGPLSQSEPKQWWSHIDINFTLPISILGRFQAHFDTLDAQKTAAFVSSGAALKAYDGWSLYCAARAGVDHFIRAMALEQQQNTHPIQCAILDPGVMDTDMQAEIRSATEDQFSQVERFKDRHEQGGLVAPAIVAKNIAAALGTSFENGARLNVAG